jgi:hypothetical protein
MNRVPSYFGAIENKLNDFLANISNPIPLNAFPS